MADQEDKFTEEEIDSSGEVVQDTEEVIEEAEENQEQFLVIRGRYKYGGRTKTYGIFELIGELESAKFNYVDLGSSSNNESVYDLFLDLDNQNFNDNLKQLIALDNSQDKTICQELKKNLVVTKVVELLEDGQEEVVEKLIKEKIEDEVQEGIKLELDWEFASQSDLVAVYPARFKETENDGASEKEDLDLGEGESEESNPDSLSDYGSEGLGLDIDLKLKCSPVISAISGKLITSFDVGDEILVRITDNSEVNSELRDKIKTSKGLGVGTIAKIDYKEEVDRYRVLVELGNKIYGQLLVGPKVMLSHPESKVDVAANDNKNIDENNNEVGVLFTIIGLFIVIIILLLLYL
ncbi:MAG: hypothetical protein ACQEP9_04855 [Bacillota bacterium]